VLKTGLVILEGDSDEDDLIDDYEHKACMITRLGFECRTKWM
jgi:hypothetical protein